MGARRRSSWQKVWQHRFLRIGIIATLIALAAFILAVWIFGWDWTGLNGGYSQMTTTSISHGTTTTTVKPPGKTLWDLLQLLIIPISLAIVVVFLTNLMQARSQRDLAEQQAQSAQKTLEQQAEFERKLAEQQARYTHEIEIDRQREDILLAYFNQISELLLKEMLRGSQKEDEVRKIARAQTLTMLIRLDKERRKSVIVFLYQAGLINKDEPIIDLHGADLSGANLTQTNLSGADLSGTNLSRAMLLFADLSGTDLSGTNLWLANLTSADLSGTDLNGAHLGGASVLLTQLEEAKSLKGATMPDYSKNS